MATKKQKRLAAQQKREEYLEQIRLEGLAAQQADREAREQKKRDDKIKASKELLEKHEREKQARRDIADAQYTACAFALGRSQFCSGDVRFPATHSSDCPHYSATDLAFSHSK